MTPPYNETVDGQPAWVGDVTGGNWQFFSANLSAYAGQTSLLRYSFRSDLSSTYAGVYIDNIAVSEANAVPLNISTTTLPSAPVGTAYSTTVERTGGTAAATWSIVGGTNHGWLTIDPATGVLSGTPDAANAGPFSVTVRVDEPSLPSNFDDVARVRKQHFNSDDGLVTMAFAARGPQFATLDVTEQDFRKARDLGLRITLHAGDGLWGLDHPVYQLNARGLLAPDTTYVHCCTLSDEEFKLIADTGGTASLSAEVELNMGHGNPATLGLMKHGCRPSISIDVCCSVLASECFKI